MQKYVSIGLIPMVFFFDTTITVLFSFVFTPFETLRDAYDYIGLSSGIMFFYCQTAMFIRYLYIDDEFSFLSRVFISYPATMITTFKANLFFIIPFAPLFIKYDFPKKKPAFLGVFIVLFLYGIFSLHLNTEWPELLEHFHIFIDDKLRGVAKLKERAIHAKPPKGAWFSIRICQITDPHLGDFCSVERLKAFCRLIVKENPDFVFLTGDFYTPAGAARGKLREALSPLLELKGRCYACYGNHDVESPEVQQMCKDELEAVGVVVLVDEAVYTSSLSGYSFQIIGLDWSHKKSRERIGDKNKILKKIEAKEDVFQLILMHRPIDFRGLVTAVPSVTFAGHTHGGMIYWIQYLANKLNLMASGLFQKGSNLLYVNRGQGSRSLGLNLLSRMSVSLEYSVCHLHFTEPNEFVLHDQIL